ncbi:hypothetical protein ACFV0Y_15455 [Streptomyces sp. NPDC059569]|uniref:hypothetical protein n=1 Tax=unclassified Streptomyces TaxID=2593676 RepID=UPI0036B324B8
MIAPAAHGPLPQVVRPVGQLVEGPGRPDPSDCVARLADEVDLSVLGKPSSHRHRPADTDEALMRKKYL